MRILNIEHYFRLNSIITIFIHVSIVNNIAYLHYTRGCTVYTVAFRGAYVGLHYTRGCTLLGGLMLVRKAGPGMRNISGVTSVTETCHVGSRSPMISCYVGTVIMTSMARNVSNVEELLQG